ncbi:Argininosuccinate lyase [Variovorax sp. PBS-H4]|uniref:Bug family tripartite tricarboxylate transporter substrate binding protein n=1 Tax=Variovorax sp. PBS-H4 TaxID=434008 RepID=UPI00131890FF|nr:tripartite tricarboxylate transporter substrate binding protein [Variovorax sp. PBS-H4]VTU37624.1 Argininosuccinate lyase [Variovorax sp. PBS-H4]
MNDIRYSRRTFLVSSGAAATWLALPAGAQPAATGWRPTRPVRLVVPYPPGGGIDIVARFIAPRMQERLGQPVVIENRGGAVGMIGSENVYRAAPDGLSFVVASADTHSINPHVYADIRYNAREFAAAAPIATLDYMLVGRPGLEAGSMKELAELGKKRELTFASSGVGSSAQVVTEALKSRYGLKMLHVPFGGSAPAAAAVMGEQVDLVMLPIAIALANRSKVKVFGVASDKRFEGAPDIPSLAEQGFPIGLEPAWIGLMAPPRTPPEILREVNLIVGEIVRDPEAKKRLTTLGLAPYTATMEEFAAHVNAEYDRWGKVVRAAEVKADSPK